MHPLVLTHPYTTDKRQPREPRAVYLDTNVYSALADELNALEVAVLPDVLRELRIEVAVSPVNLWEILSTGDPDRRENLVWVAQHVSPVPLLVEVEQIVAGHAAEVVGDPRVAHLAGHSKWSTSHLAQEWGLTRSNPARTIRMDEGADTLRLMKETQRLLHAVVSRGLSQLDYVRAMARALSASRRGDRSAVADAFRKEAKAITMRRPLRGPSDYGEIAALVATYLLTGLTPYPDPIDEFWSCLGIDSPIERSRLIEERLAPMMSEGPMMALVAVTDEQARTRYNPGNWFDAYHLQYLQVIPELVTFDQGLLRLCHRQPEGSRLVTGVSEASQFVAEVVRAVRSV